MRDENQSTIIHLPLAWIISTVTFRQEADYLNTGLTRLSLILSSATGNLTYRLRHQSLSVFQEDVIVEYL